MSLATVEREATQPMEVVLIRHGESEANLVQKAEKDGQVSPYAELVYSRHDFQHHLTEKGVKQAKAARLALMGMGIQPELYFDEYYLSPFVRTKETFAYITDGNVDPLTDIRLIERDWGNFGRIPLSQRQELYAETERLKDISNFWVRYDNGQNIPDTSIPMRDWISTTNRELTGGRVLAVTHGEKMWVARFTYEGLTPDQWDEMDKDTTLRIGNCCILQYSRQNPEDPEDLSRTISHGWRRMVDPYTPERSPYGGEWVKMEGRTRLNGKEMLAAAEAYDRVPDETEEVLEISS